MNSVSIEHSTEMFEVIRSCEVCYVGMSDTEGKPYVLPFNFFADEQNIYLHSGPGGKKTGILRQNPLVSIAFSTGHQLYHQHPEVACSYSMKFKSVIVEGSCRFIEDQQQKSEVLENFMKKYVGRNGFKYSRAALSNVVVMKIDILEMSGRKKGW